MGFGTAFILGFLCSFVGGTDSLLRAPSIYNYANWWICGIRLFETDCYSACEHYIPSWRYIHGHFERNNKCPTSQFNHVWQNIRHNISNKTSVFLTHTHTHAAIFVTHTHAHTHTHTHGHHQWAAVPSNHHGLLKKTKFSTFYWTSYRL